ncbi:biotin/lipoyl-containing protein, partial [Rugosimonospora acidiphila]|uniref:biotin/lipoyl-containing protein n=1 Tax=Rugosimonospora acidiphila TaxID=556531 RepID=UPI0031E6326C
MPTYRRFSLPDLGEGLPDGEILSWLVRPGDAVTDGQVVCTAETAKAAVDLPIPFTGVVHEIHVPEGATVNVGTVLVTVDVEPAGAEPPDTGPADAEPTDTGPADTGPADTGPADTESADAEVRQPVLVGYGPGGSRSRRHGRSTRPSVTRPAVARPAAARPAATRPTVARPAAARPVVARPEPPDAAEPVRPLAKPPVRKLARDLGVDLTVVVPSGPGGRVSRDDLLAV